jgi:integrase
MAHVERRGSGRWRARFRGPDGREHSKTFTRRIDAERFLDVQRGQLAQGQWIDPAGARTTVAEYVDDWRRGLTGRATTLEQVDSHLRKHVLPRWGELPLGSITRAQVQEWVIQLAGHLSPTTVEAVYRRFAAVMLAAVEDRLIGISPCRKIDLPEQPHRMIEPLPAVAVAALVEAMPVEARAVVVLAAGSGLRQGECLGLTVDRVDFLRRSVRVDRQLVTVTGSGPVLGPPKTRASVRTVPVGRVVIDELAHHLAEHPADEATGMIFKNRRGEPYRRNRFAALFSDARAAAGLPSTVRFHDLRHFYASVLIDAGEPSHVIKERLGHASITETHDTYGHLFPSANERTRSALDGALGSLPIRGLAR